MIKLTKKLNAEKIYLISSAVLTVVLATTPASANKSSPTPTKSKPLINDSNLKTVNNNSFNNNVTYSASGKIDKKMAIMMVNLLRNPHLQVRAEINGQPLQTISPETAINNPMNLLAKYIISGKTDRKTALKLKKLIQSGQPIEIVAEAIFNRNHKEKIVHSTPKQDSFRGFIPFHSNVTPPTFVQDNTIWIPVLMSKPVANKSTIKTQFLALK